VIRSGQASWTVCPDCSWSTWTFTSSTGELMATSPHGHSMHQLFHLASGHSTTLLLTISLCTSHAVFCISSCHHLISCLISNCFSRSSKGLCHSLLWLCFAMPAQSMSDPSRPTSVKPGPKVDPPFEETWAALEKCVEEGLIRSIGVSNFSPEKIESSILPMAKIRPAVNQVCLPVLTPTATCCACCNAMRPCCSPFMVLYAAHVCCQPASCFECVDETMRLLGLCNMQCSSCMVCCMRVQPAAPVTMMADWCGHCCYYAVK